MTTDILLATEGALAIVTLNRPQRRNALTLAAWRALEEIFRDLANNDQVRVVILTGADGHFCSGADIGEFGTLRRNPEEGVTYEQAVDAAHDAITGLRKPVIAAIDGFCIGGGCGLALACDFRWAAETARFGVPAAKLGLVYGDRETRNLLTAVGMSTAKRILFSGERFDAATALRYCLIDEIVSGHAIDRVRDFAQSLAANSPISMAGAKLLLRSIQQGGDAGDPEVRALMSQALSSEDYKEGVAAFAERRKPRFTGR